MLVACEIIHSQMQSTIRAESYSFEAQDPRLLVIMIHPTKPIAQLPTSALDPKPTSNSLLGQCKVDYLIVGRPTISRYESSHAPSLLHRFRILTLNPSTLTATKKYDAHSRKPRLRIRNRAYPGVQEVRRSLAPFSCIVAVASKACLCRSRSYPNNSVDESRLFEEIFSSEGPSEPRIPDFEGAPAGCE